VTALAGVHVERLPLPLVFAATAGGFLFIYFGVGGLAHLLVTRVFPALGRGRTLAERPLAPGQLGREVRQSLVSIAIFGGYGVLTAVGARAGLWQVVPLRSAGGVALEIALLVLWNDLHFYAIHRLLHGRWLFQHVHREHHRAIRPTPLSTYAMHPVEALLLGSVMVLVQPFHAFSLPTLLLFPLVSLAMNNLGHMNYDLVPDSGLWHPLAASRRHERHHRQVTGNYGFLLPVLDRWFGTQLPDGAAATDRPALKASP
jgi:sterol desaturase/sphingolipid hydroxylase (fatty acid hydroxylase superfamily)